MKYHLVIQGPNGPLPAGPHEGDALPQIGDTFTETIGDKKLSLEVVGLQFLPVVPSGIFKHDEAWVICRILSSAPAPTE